MLNQADRRLAVYADLLRKYGHLPRLYQMAGYPKQDAMRCVDCGHSMRVSARIPNEEGIAPCLAK